MWLYLAIASALFLGCYDVVKKQSLKRNSVMWVLLSISLLSTIILGPFFTGGDAKDFLALIPKAFLVTLSWISGLIGMKMLPLTTVSTIKASRPVFVILLSMLIFGERLNPWQWVGVVIVLAALWMLGGSSRKEGIYFSRNKGVLWMALSVFSGVFSALYDKFAIARMEPMFVQCWSNLFITILMGVVLLFDIRKKRRTDSGDYESGNLSFHWDWYLLAAAVMIVVADAFYFYSLKADGALLAVISLIRRTSVIVTFIVSALVFKEKNIRDKAVILTILFGGTLILFFAS